MVWRANVELLNEDVEEMAVHSVSTAHSVGARDDGLTEQVSESRVHPNSTAERKQKLRFDKLHKELRREVGKAIEDYAMIEEGDRVMVCLSGGKDSYTMLDILLSLQKAAPVNFELIAVNLDQKQPGFPREVLPNYLTQLGVHFKIIEEDTYSTVMRVVPEGKTLCSLCSRLRRGILYRVASELNCNKMALGHHREDRLETFFLNLFFGGKLKSMPAKLRSDDGKHIVIRPLAYCREKQIAKYARIKEFPIIPCNLCGSQENLQRKVIKNMLQEWDRTHPGRVESIHRSLENIIPSHLGDFKLYDFKQLRGRDWIEQLWQVQGRIQVVEDDEKEDQLI